MNGIHGTIAVAVKIFLGMLISITLLMGPLHAAESGDSQLFIDGFNAYQKEEYKVAVDKLSQALKDYPASPLRDMTLFWLARASYRTGDRQQAAKVMSTFLKEYPDHPLKGTVEEEVLKLAAQYDHGYSIAQNATQPVDTAPKKPAKSAKSQPAEKKTAPPPAAAPEKAVAPPVVVAKTEPAPAPPVAKVVPPPAPPAKVEPPVAKVVVAKTEPPPAPPAPPKKEVPVANVTPPVEKPVAAKVEPPPAPTAPVAKVTPPAEKPVAAKVEPPPAPAQAPRQEQPVAKQTPPPAEPVVVAKAEPVSAAFGKSSEIASDEVAQIKDVMGKGSSGKTTKPRQRESKDALKDKAIADYRNTIEKFPGTPAAQEATERLRKLGVPVKSAATAPADKKSARSTSKSSPSSVLSLSPGRDISSDGGSSQVVTLEIEQYADLGLAVSSPTARPEAGSQLTIPVEVTNRGNGGDSYSLESGFPAEYSPRFTDAGNDSQLVATPKLGAGESWRGLLRVTIPAKDVDGQKIHFPVRAASQFNRTVTRTSEIQFTVSAPLLRGIMKPEQATVLPGENVSYRVTILNIGSAPARGIQFRLDYPAPLDPVGFTGFRQENGVLVMSDINLTSGQSKEAVATFRLRPATPARQDLICRGELFNPSLRTKETFVSSAATVSTVNSLALSVQRDRLVVLPGQTVAVPLTVTNSGNVRDSVNMAASAPAGYSAAFYNDANQNGLRDKDEQQITQTGALSPNETVHLVLELTAPTDGADGANTVIPITANLTSQNATAKDTANLRIAVIRPRVELSVVMGGAGKLKPGEVTSVNLVCHNRGSALARAVTIRSVLPSQLELIATEPPATSNSGGELTWTIPELGADEKRSMRINVRVKPGVTAGASLAISNRVTYQDNLGNRY